MHRRSRWFAQLVCLCVFASALNVSAQVVTARLDGLVQDQSQAVIPGVTIVVTNEATNIAYTSVTNETGRYVFVAIPPGTYRIEAELPGFKRAVSGGVLLQVGDARTVNMTLEPGSVEQTVDVVAESPLMDLTTTKIGAVIEQRQIVDLPLNGRNAMMLFYLAPGVNPLDALGSQQQHGTVDGLAPHTNSLKVEGVLSSPASFDESPSVSSFPVPMEAVGEYRITTSGGLSEGGRGSGSKTSVFLKSGTNQIHGSVFEFNRNTIMEANNFFTNRAGQTRPVLNRNQFGFSLGGPAIKNKTFYFGTVEISRQSAGSIRNLLVYTPTLRTGIFRYNTQRANSVADVDRNGNPLVPYGTLNLLTVDPTRQGMDTVFLPKVLAALPAPNNYSLGDGMNTAGYQFTYGSYTNTDQELFKIDHELNKSHHLSFSASHYDSLNPNAPLITKMSPGNTETRTRGASLRLISTLSPRITNELSAGTNLFKQLFPVFDLGQNTPNGTGNIQLVGLGNGNIYSTSVNQFHSAAQFGFSDTLSWIKGNHTFSFGGEFWHEQYNRVSASFNPFPVLTTDITNNPANVPALPGLSANDRTNAAQFTNDLTGSIGTINQSFNVRKSGYTPYQGNYMPMRGGESSMFFQDIWKLRPTFTVDLGLRYDWLPGGYVSDGTAVQPIGGVAGALGIQGPTGQPTKWGFAPNTGRDIVHTDKKNFGPNVGFSWNPFGQGTTTVSASYGIAYDRLPLTTYAQFSQANYGSTTTVTLTPFARLSDAGFYGKIMPVPAPTLFADLGFIRSSRAYVVDPNLTTPYTQNWTLHVARQIGTAWKVEGSYVGNHAVGMWRAENLNQIEIRNNGFLNAFKIAQSNLAANGTPTTGQSLGNLQNLFSQVPSSQYNLITTGQAAALADFLDTTTLKTGVRGGLVTASGLPVTFFRFNPQVQNLNIVGNRSHSTWDGLKLSLTRQMQRGLMIRGNYTFGRGFTDYIPAQGLYEDYRDNANFKLDKSLQDYDSTHQLTVNWIYDLPIGRGRSLFENVPALVDAILGGWQINGIQTVVSGRPLRVSTGVCASSIVATTCSSGRFTLNNNIAATPNFSGSKFDMNTVNTAGSVVTTLTPAQKAQFSNPGPGYQGDLPRVSLRGPGYRNLDASVFKKFKLTRLLGEAGEAQLRIQLYNVLNQVEFGNPDTNINSGTFGVITSAQSPRIGEIALKIVF